MNDKERRCLKFTGYIYIPDKEVLTDKKAMKYYMGKNPGRVQFHDEHGKKIGTKMSAFITIGDLANKISNQALKMWQSRFKK